MSKSPSILWVDDQPIQVEECINYLQDSGYEVEMATSATLALSALKRRSFDVIVLDVMMPPEANLPPSKTKGGYETGIYLAREIQKLGKDALIVGCSVHPTTSIRDWFTRFASGFITKEDLYPLESFAKKLSLLMKHGKIPPTVFIVHGHADADKLALKNFLQNSLSLPEPIILHERPNFGRTIIEKFEAESKDVDLAFVLLTPDDLSATASDPEDTKMRARQNVIFELGFFFAKLQRKSGRVVLLHRGGLELPSDIAGIVYIDISGGIESAAEKIRRELAGIL